MRTLYIEDASDITMAPSRASAVREGGGEASVGVRAGGLLSLVKSRSGCRRCHMERKATSSAAFSRAVGGPRGVGEPVHARSLQMREPGGPTVTRLW